MRQEIAAESLLFEMRYLPRKVRPIAGDFGMRWKITDSAVKSASWCLVSKQDHCLSDLLYR